MRFCSNSSAQTCFGKAEVGDVVAVQVADLAAADGEGELAAAANACVHARPRGDFSW